MLSLGLTGGIAAGKSLLSHRFRQLGAVVIDADRLARDVVASGTPGLAAVVARFGAEVLAADGSLDRPRLGSIVFSDPQARADLNGIVHPLVRAAAAAMEAEAGPDNVVVQDIPLLVETGQASAFHLVVVVEAPEEERLARMVAQRGMSREDAVARIAAQASDAERAAVADVRIVNDGSAEQAVARLDELWHERILPFAAGLAGRVPAPRRSSNHPADIAALERAAARIKRTVGQRAATNIVMTHLEVRAAAPAPELPQLLAGAGYFPIPDGARGSFPSPDGGEAKLFASADPGNPAVVHLFPHP